MADNLITTNITANADFTGLRTQLAATTAQLIKLQETTAGTNSKLANQIAVMNKAFATTLTSTGQFSQHFVSLTSDVEKFGKNLDGGRLKLGEYYNAWNGHTKKTSSLIKDLAKQQVMLQNAVVQPVGKNAQGLMQYNVMVAKGLDEVKNKMAIATQQAAIMNKVMKDGATQLINWGKNTQWAGRQLTVGLTVPLAAFGMAAQKAFRDADAELVRLTKVYGGLSAVSATELAKVRKDVSDTAREIAGSYGIAYKDTIALAADLAATGAQGEELLKATKETSRLAILGEVDRQDAMKATLAIQNAFKQSTQELSESINFLNAVENQTSTSLQDLTEAIPKAGPVIKSLGGDVQDLALYLTAMKEGGVNASEGANAIKSAMASLINPTKVAKELFFGFGIDIDNIVTSNAGNLTATIVELQSSLDKLDPLSKSRAIEQLFGKFQYARMSALFENMGKEGSQTLQVMDLMKASATDLAGIADRELGMMTESASGKFKRALASVQADLAVVGDQFLRISTKVLEVVDGIIKFFQGLPAPVKSFLTALGGLTAVAGPIIMLAGVMGNFIGYVVKGIFHLRELVKGGQGFRLLTPEIVAADAAAKGLATTFYSDAEATVVLTNAVNALTNSFALLETKAASAAVKVQPGITTVAGTVLSAGGAGGRMVDKDNPLIGRPYSRDMSHLTPAGTSQMGTIFGTVPGAGPVNVRIGKNPQAYMDSDLPRIPGVTSVNGISTGIVSQEAAKWHAMTAAIAMQSEAEIKTLKAEVMSTGTVTSSLSDSYQALLPEFTEITSMAAQETAAIVKQLQASKITVDQARAKILQLNATVEAMLAETAALTASGMGRTVNLTTVPLTGQPVVDPVTGKSNMKEMFHKGTTKDIADRIARALGGVRTSGAGYNIQTTKPKFAKGGIVPGTGNTDTYHTTAEPGAFVINKKSTEQNMPIIDRLLGGARPYNIGGQVPVVLTPGEAVIPANVAQKDMPLMYALNGGPGNTSGMGRATGGSISMNIFEGLKGWLERNTDQNYDSSLKNRVIVHDAAVLNSRGFSEEESINMAKRDFEAAMAKSKDSKTGKVNRKTFNAIRIQQARAMQDYIAMQGMGYKDIMLKDTPESLEKRPQVTTYRPTPKLLSALFSRLDIDQVSLKGIINSFTNPDGTINYTSEHLDRDRMFATTENGVRRSNRTAGNAYYAMGGNKMINNFTNWLAAMTSGKFVDRVPLSQQSAQISADTLAKELRYGKASSLMSRLPAIAKGHMMTQMMRMLLTRGKSLPISKPIAANAGGMIPGNFAQKLFPGGTVNKLFLGMPRTIKQVEAQRAAKIAMDKASEAAKNSRFGQDKPIQYGDLLEPTSGRSFPVAGIGGIYSRDGEKVFVKPMLDEKAALAEMRATEIARDVHGLHAPKQKIVVMKDPTDPTGKRNLLALESKFDKTFAEQDGKFTTDQYFRQLVASALRGDKDLGRGNLSGNTLADVGTAGVFSTASGLRDYSAVMPPFKQQALVNLMGVKGSNAKKFFAESTASIPKGMTADQYNDRMLQEINEALPKLRQSVSRFPDLSAEEKVIYNQMIERLELAKKQTYQDLHGVHSSLKISPEKTMTPAAIAKMIAADELKRRQKGHSVGLSNNAFKTPENGFNIGGMIGNVLKGKAMHKIGAGFGPTGAPKPSMYESAPWGVNSLSIEMAEKLFASSGLRKSTQKHLYDKFAANLAKEKPYGYVKMPDGTLKNGLEPDSLDAVIRSAASDLIGDRNVLKQLSPIDKDILRKKYLNWDSKKDTPMTEALKKLIFEIQPREMGGPVNSGKPYLVGEKGPEIFVPRNAGGIVPNTSIAIPPQGYNAGGMIKMMLMSMLGMQGGQALGKMSGIPGGDMIGMMLGSMLGMGSMGGGGAKVPMTSKGRFTAPMGATRLAEGPTQIGQKEVRSLTSYGERLQKASLEGGKFAKMGVFAAKALTRLNLAVGLVSLAVGIGINRYKAYNESMRLNALGYGMTAEGAEKAGLKFTNFNDKIKEAIANATALKERNTLLYESMKGAGTPLNITIEEYKKLKKEVKDNYSDQVLLINKTGADDQAALAVRLKEQLIAMGLSAEEATKKIYAMYAASNFSASAAKYTVASDAFNKIKDTASAAVSAIESLNKAMETDRDPTEQANQLNTVMMAISTDLEKRQADAIKKARALATKEGTYFSTGDENAIKFEQEKIAMDELNSKVKNQAVLTTEVVNELAKVDPAIRQIINEQDTSISLWQKTRIQVKGYTGDLKSLTAAQTNDLYNLQITLGKAIESANRAEGGVLEKQYAQLDINKKKQAEYERAAKGQKVKDQLSDRDKLSALQKQIDANNKLADARIKALNAAKEEGDLGREIAKKQAEYNAAIAKGDNESAQIASIDIQGLQGQMQFNSQVKAEENARDLKNAPLLKQIEGIQNKQKKLADNAALAGEALGDLNKVISTQETAIDDVNSAMLAYEIELLKQPEALRKTWKAGKESETMLAAVATAAEKAGVKLNGLKDLDLGKALVEGLDSKLGAISTIDVKGNVTIMIDGKKFDIGKGGDGTKNNPFSSGSVADAVKAVDQGRSIPEKIKQAGAASVGISGINQKSFSRFKFNTTTGGFSDSQVVKDYAKLMDYKEGSFFRLQNEDGSYVHFKVRDAAGNIDMVDAPKKAMGGYIKNYSEGSGGGVKGPGTGTSDSIPAMLSNGEYVVRASAVKQYGVPFFDDLNAQKFAAGGMAKNKSLMQPEDKWDNRSTTQSIGKFFLGNVGPQSVLLNALPKDIKNKITSAMWSMFGKSFEEIAAGSPTKGDWANAALSAVPFGGAAAAPKAALGLKNIKEAKAWTHYAHQAATEVFPSIGRKSNSMANYGIGTYGSTSADLFKGAQFGEESHRLSLSPLALIKTALGKGPITDAGLAKEAAAFNKATGKKISGSAMYLNDEEFVSFLSKRGYSGYKVDDVVTNWKIGSGGFGLKNSLGKIPFGKQPAPISYPELPDMPGILFAQGGYVNPTYSANMSVPSFDNGINSVPVDMLAMIHKNEAIVPANMNPFNPGANNATMGSTFNITNNINGFDGDINQLSRMVTQQTVSAIKSLDGRSASMVGPKMNVSIA